MSPIEIPATFSYDSETGAGYVSLNGPTPPEGVTRTVEAPAAVSADLDADGRLLGVEIIGAIPGLSTDTPDTPLPRIYGFKEFLEAPDPAFLAGRRFYDDNVIADIRWNGWRINPDHLVLELFDAEGRHTYEVDLERCVDSAHILDWLAQVSSKVWGGHNMDKVLAGLLRAVNDILRLQANVCPNEVHKVLTSQRIRELVAAYLASFHAGEHP